MTGIYKITNQINDKSYIGQSVNISQRWREHRSRYQLNDSSEYNSLIHKAMRKYGIENFTWDVLEQCSAEELNEREIYWIQYYHTWIEDVNCNGYNINSGGNYRSRNSNEKIKAIIQDLQNCDLSQELIAKKYNVSSNTISLINCGKQWYDPQIQYPIRSRKKIARYCVDCGKEISLTAIRCTICSHKAQEKRNKKPTREELKQLIRTTSFVAIGKQFGVSDNAVRKWCKVENLPYRSKEIKQYTDKEWELI